MTVIFRFTGVAVASLATLLTVGSVAQAGTGDARPSAAQQTPPNPFLNVPNPYAAVAPSTVTPAAAAPAAAAEDAGVEAAVRAPSTVVAQPRPTRAPEPRASDESREQASPRREDPRAGEGPQIRVATTGSHHEMAALAAHAAAQPVPDSDDHAIAALDAALSGDELIPVPAHAPAEPTGVPTRAEVSETIARVAPTIRRCVQGHQAGRVIHVSTRFGSNGRVTSAVVEANTAHVTPRERSCMARAARTARTPAFENERFDVRFPVRL